jgi:sulfate adenylyltransferase
MPTVVLYVLCCVLPLLLLCCVPAPTHPPPTCSQFAREQVAASGGFIQVYLKTPLETCEQRDRKGLYKKARSGILPNFTGISDPYEAPTDKEADLILDTSQLSVAEATDVIIKHLQKLGFLEADAPAAAAK